MHKITIQLGPAEFKRLQDLAHSECRSATQQAKWLILATVRAQPPQRQSIVDGLLGYKRSPGDCPHGEPAHECNACAVASDFAFDTQREH